MYFDTKTDLDTLTRWNAGKEFFCFRRTLDYL